MRVLDAQEGRPETIVTGRYILPGGKRSRDPLGGPEIKCNVDTDVHRREAAGPSVRLASGDGSCTAGLDVAERTAADAA